MASVSSRSLTQHVLSFPSAHSPRAASNASSSCPPTFRAGSSYSLPKRRAQIHASRASVVGGPEKLGTGFRGSRIGLGSVSERSAELQQLRQGAESGSAVNMITWNRELLFNVLLPLGGGLIASAFAAPNLKLYGDLKKPKWAPPAPLFGNVWSFIYLSIGYAAWLVYRDAGGFSAQPGLWKIYGAQLILNWLWQPLFFTKQFLGVAFIDLVLLWFTIIALIGKFSAINTLAGKALIPYLAWVTFAGALNWNLWQNNPAKDKDPQELKPKAA